MLAHPSTKRVAVIDLGSNTARLVVISTVPGYAYNLSDEIREVVRLREGMSARGLSADATERALFTLRLFKDYCDSAGVDEVIATATSAVRDAYNGAVFIEHVKEEIGLSLKVLDGEQEAYYGTLGALNEVPISSGFVVDIGGGSAQISEVNNRQFHRGSSLPLGALALTEQFVNQDPISNSELMAVQQKIDRQLDSVDWLKEASGQKEGELVGLGGTIRNLARMQAEREGYPLDTMHGYNLTRESLSESVELLTRQPLADRKKLLGLNSDRADIILPGAMVIATIMDLLQKDSLTISVNGLREGLFFERFWHHLSYPVAGNVRRFSVLNMARVYNYEKKHANHVRFLADRLFEQLLPLHGYDLDDLRLLDAAAILHDLGSIIDYYDHHKHSQMLIANRGLAGYQPRETALIALLTRYHRKGKPSLDPYNNLMVEHDELKLMRLAAMLRMAEFLERGRNGNVDDVTASWDGTVLRLTVVADEYPAVELWEAEKNASRLIEKAFDKELVLESTAAPAPWVNSVFN
jgi:exopolyphosphatase/guanosine-5'-triphosphate,3'-diphosphate pyrophosphatase